MTMENNSNNAPENKTFTQDDVNRIVQERLAEDRKKQGQTLEQRERDLAARELKHKVREQAAAEGIPVELVDVLNITDEASMKKAFEAVKKELTFQSEPHRNPVGPTKNEASEAAALHAAFGLSDKKG
jgi:hypothetical protein